MCQPVSTAATVQLDRVRRDAARIDLRECAKQARETVPDLVNAMSDVTS